MSALSNNSLDQQWQAHYCLVADIGGTHARFAIAKKTHNTPGLLLENQQTYQVAEFKTISSAILDYLNKISAPLRPKHAVLAVASAVTSDHISFTNSAWGFSIPALKNELALDELQVINDFAAVAWALPTLQETDIEAIGSSHAFSQLTPGVYVALGPGTGLGVAALKIEQDHYTVIETEGGHISFAPRSTDEIEMLQFLQEDFERVSYERLLSGSGLLNLYRARSHLMQLPTTLPTPEAVSSAARQNNPAACAAVQDFCSILGAFAGDAVLMFGAWSGVYLAGGLLPHVMDEKGKLAFRKAFEDKGRFAPLMKQTPAWQIKRMDIGNLGAASVGLKARPSKIISTENQE